MLPKVSSDGVGDLHVITVPMGRGQTQSRTSCTTVSQNRPPDYFLVTEKPPSYEEAMSMLPRYPTTHSGSLQLNAEGGLEDFLAPHQVPESQPEGAIGGLLQQSDARMQQPDSCKESETLLNISSSPPAYSQCASHSTFVSSNNSTIMTPQEGTTDSGTTDSTTLGDRTNDTTNITNSTVDNTDTESRTSPLNHRPETEGVTSSSEEPDGKSLKIKCNSIEKDQKSDSTQSLSDQMFSINVEK